MQANHLIRPATNEDHQLISTLLKFEYYVHRHLDWRTPLDWLGRQPFWVIEHKRRALAGLACPPDPPEIAWVRFFACTSAYEPETAWNVLFEKVKEDLARSPSFDLAALALQDWFAQLLQNQGFYHHQDIVVLAWEAASPPARQTTPGLFIRRFQTNDLPAVQVLDERAFERLWRISLGTLTRSYEQSAYATIAEMNGDIVGYQISTASNFSAHLARLAVEPDRQRAGIGAALVHDLQSHFYFQRLRFVTVNTQSDNHTSLSLYDRMGFLRSGERFPVYRLPASG
jgi:[ribosomal protein S18]-alanine N-acetyltransferase